MKYLGLLVFLISQSLMAQIINWPAGKFLPDPQAGGVPYSTATSYVLLPAGTNGQCFLSGGTGAPSWGACGIGSAITSLNGQTGATQVFANDTNVVVTSSNNTHTLGWASTLSMARGGSGAALSAANGAIAYSSASALALSSIGTSGQVLTSNGAAAPSWALAVDATKLPLAGGTMSGAINMGGFGINNMLDPAVGTDAATKSYVDNKVNGLTWKDSVVQATQSALPSNTYNNGTSGLGATLTATGNGALTVDSNLVNVADRILVKNEVTTSHNGIYVVTQAGDGSHPYILTRSTDFDCTPSGDNTIGSTVLDSNGTATGLDGTTWTMTTSGTITCGTTAQVFSQSAGPGLNIAGTGISISGNTISLLTPVSIANGGSNNSSLGPVLGGVVYTDATKLNTLAAGTAGQFLRSNGGAAPSWVVPTDTGITSLNSQTGITQVFSNDANVVVTSSNNTHALGWASTLSLSRGGTQNALSAVNGGVVYSDASKLNIIAAGTSGQFLQSSGAGAPTWASAVTAAITSLNAQTGATQVYANDTNVVVTSSNNTHTLGWASTLSLARGGTGGAVTSATGGIVYGASTSAMSMTVAGTAGQVILSGGAGAPTFEGPLALNHGGSNASLTAANGGIVYSDASKMAILAAGTSGQVLTSGGAAAPTWSTPSAGITSLNSQTGATQVFANDTNVVVTSSGNTHTLGWASTLSLARGGTQAALTATNGGIVYSNATTLAVLAIGTSGNVLSSNGGTAPSWISSSSVGNPTGWTCTVRTGGSSGGISATASCTGNEKVIAGGCGPDGSGSLSAIESRPTGQGWFCTWPSSGSTTTYANCCL